MTFLELLITLALMMAFGYVVPDAAMPAALVIMTYLVVQAAPKLLEAWASRRTSIDDLKEMIALLEAPQVENDEPIP